MKKYTQVSKAARNALVIILLALGMEPKAEVFGQKWKGGGMIEPNSARSRRNEQKLGILQ